MLLQVTLSRIISTKSQFSNQPSKSVLLLKSTPVRFKETLVIPSTIVSIAFAFTCELDKLIDILSKFSPNKPLYLQLLDPNFKFDKSILFSICVPAKA